MKPSEIARLHASGIVPVPRGHIEYAHIIYDNLLGFDVHVCVTPRGDGSWLLRETFTARNEPRPGGYQLVLQPDGEMFTLSSSGALHLQTRFTLERFQQLVFEVQTSIL